MDALYPLLNLLFPAFVSTLQEVALAMIAVVVNPYQSTTLEVKDIKKITMRK
jgi:hypothetical protein